MQKNNDIRILCDRLRMIRSELSMTQEDMARIIGIGKSALSMIETGRASLSERNRNILIQTLNVNPEWLESGTGAMFNEQFPERTFLKGSDRPVGSQSVPLYNVMAVVILMLEGPEAAQAGSMTAKLKKSVKGILTNPTLLGIAAGFAWSLLGLPMPTMAGKTLSSIASLTSPLALLAIGAGFKGRKALGYLRPTAVATAVKLMALPALFLPVAVHLGFTDEKLVALLVMLGSIATPSCYVMAKQMGHEGVLTGSVCVTTTLFSAFSLTFWLFLLRSMGCIA